MKTNLTIEEALCLATCLNYNDLERQLDDNISVAGTNCFAKAMQTTTSHTKKVIKGMEKKDLGIMDDDPTRPGGSIDLFLPSEKGLRLVFRYLAMMDDHACRFIDFLKQEHSGIFELLTSAEHFHHVESKHDGKHFDHLDGSRHEIVKLVGILDQWIFDNDLLTFAGMSGMQERIFKELFVRRFDANLESAPPELEPGSASLVLELNEGHIEMLHGTTKEVLHQDRLLKGQWKEIIAFIKELNLDRDFLK